MQFSVRRAAVSCGGRASLSALEVPVAKVKIPNALRMRELKYGDASDAECEALALALRAAGRRPEAVLLYERQPEADFLREEVQWAIAEGNGFHLLAMRHMGRSISAEALRDCARAAEQHGRWLDARGCYLALDDEAAIRKISEHLPESMQTTASEDEPE